MINGGAVKLDKSPLKLAIDLRKPVHEDDDAYDDMLDKK
jgi:hypothetical protein